MKVVFFKDDRVPILVLRGHPTVYPVAQVLAKIKAGRKKIWMFKSPNEARQIAVRICYDTLGVDYSESFKLSEFIIRRPRSIRYGLELVRGRVSCHHCACLMEYERFGHRLCRFHYKHKPDVRCTDCTPKFTRRERR